MQPQGYDEKATSGRLLYLWTVELFNAVVLFPALYLSIRRGTPLGWFSLVALLAVCAQLLVGAAFWFLKWREFDGSDALHRPATRQLFLTSKRLFRLVVGGLVLLLGVRVFAQPAAPIADIAVGGAFMLLAILEYVNYYVVQLSYDNAADLRYLRRHRKLKRAVMVRELGI